MSFATRTWRSLPVEIKVLAILTPIAVVLGGAVSAAAWFGGPPLLDFLGANLPLVRFVIAATAIIVMTIPIAFLIIYMELKVIARMNLRVGPNRVGPWGAAHSVIHGFKVLTKEDFTPSGADTVVFTLAPVVTFLGSIMTLLVIPFAPGLFGQDMNIGLLYFFSMGGLTVVGLLMAGWSSFNKYSLLGGMRSAAQMISYEIPLTLSVVGVIMLAGSMSTNHIVEAQSGSFLDWFVFKQPLGALIFFIAATAEANRTPFDMTEADSEIVAGFATEYSGMRFGFFFFAEYVNVFIVSAIVTTIFFGGWTAPFAWPFAWNLDWIPTSPMTPIWLFALPGVLLILGELLAVPVKLIGGRDWGYWDVAVMGILIAGLIVTALAGLLAFVALEPVRGIFWFFAKTFAFVFTFIWMRATLPRVRVDQLMGFAWKWLLPAALLNLFVTALAVILINPGGPR
jgi:NADH-quinone oxidoreductase subunit H